MTELYEQRIFPVLTPLAVDPSHPFPYISNLALSIAAMVADPDPESDDRRFARVKVPTVFPRLVEVDESRFIPVEDLIIAHLHTLFAGMVIEEAATFRVTRNADLTLEDEEAEDLLEALEMELRRRRFNKAVRLEVSEAMSDEMLDLLVRELELTRPTSTAAGRRSTSASSGSCTASTGPTSRTGRGRRSPPGASPPPRRPTARSSRSCATGRSSSTTPTRASPAAPRRSSSRPPTTRGCRASR